MQFQLSTLSVEIRTVEIINALDPQIFIFSNMTLRYINLKFMAVDIFLVIILLLFIFMVINCYYYCCLFIVVYYCIVVYSIILLLFIT